MTTPLNEAIDDVLPYIGVNSHWLDLEKPSLWDMRLWHVIFIFMAGFASVGNYLILQASDKIPSPKIWVLRIGVKCIKFFSLTSYGVEKIISRKSRKVYQHAGLCFPVIFFCCCIKFRIPRTKQEIEADYIRKKITRKFKKQLKLIHNADMDEMDLKKGQCELNFVLKDAISKKTHAYSYKLTERTLL